MPRQEKQVTPRTRKKRTHKSYRIYYISSFFATANTSMWLVRILSGSFLAAAIAHFSGFEQWILVGVALLAGGISALIFSYLSIDKVKLLRQLNDQSDQAAKVKEGESVRHSQLKMDDPDAQSNFGPLARFILTFIGFVFDAGILFQLLYGISTIPGLESLSELFYNTPWVPLLLAVTCGLVFAIIRWVSLRAENKLNQDILLNAWTLNLKPKEGMRAKKPNAIKTIAMMLLTGGVSYLVLQTMLPGLGLLEAPHWAVIVLTVLISLIVAYEYRQQNHANIHWLSIKTVFFAAATIYSVYFLTEAVCMIFFNIGFAEFYADSYMAAGIFGAAVLCGLLYAFHYWQQCHLDLKIEGLEEASQALKAASIASKEAATANQAAAKAHVALQEHEDNSGAPVQGAGTGGSGDQ